MSVAFVTGGAQGIGAAVARRFTADGLDVTVGDLEEKRVAAESEGLRFAPLDVTDEGSVRRAIGDAGEVDVLVNCAGVTIAGHHVDDVSLADWQLQIGVNLTGTFLTTRAVVPSMRSRRRGRIVNLASALATRGLPGSSAYAASKAGVVGFTRAVAEEGNGHGAGAAALELERGARGKRDARADDSIGTEEAELRVDHVQRTTLGAVVPVSARVQLGVHPPRVGAPGEHVPVTAVRACDRVVRPKRGAHAHGHRLLSDRRVQEAGDEAGQSELRDALFEPADQH